MLLNVYSIFDAKLAVFNTPFFARANGEAIRSFSDLVHDSRTTVAQHPEDFSLFHIGQYDDEKGCLLPSHPLNLVQACSFVSDASEA